MSRVEITLWTLLVLALAATTTAKADHFLPGPPVSEGFALSNELSGQAAALSYEAEAVLCRDRDLRDVQEELRDLADDLRDLNRALEDAANNPRKWDRVEKRARRVAKQVDELDEEIHEAIDDMNRHRPRQTAFIPRGPVGYGNDFTPGPTVAVGFQLGRNGRVQIVGQAPGRNSLGQVYSTPYRGTPQGYTPLRVGTELEQRVHLMRDIAVQLQHLACAG